MIKQYTQAICWLFFLHLWSNCYAQTYSDYVTDKEVSVFFKQLSKSLDSKIQKMDVEPIDWTEPDLYGERDTLYQMGWLTRGIFQNDTVQHYFNKSDLEFVKEQFHDLSGSRWKEKDFLKFELVDTIFYRKILSHSYNSKKVKGWYLYSFSMPLFSADRKYAIIQQEYYCGYMCSEYCVYLYEKIPDTSAWRQVAKWKCIKA